MVIDSWITKVDRHRPRHSLNGNPVHCLINCLENNRPSKSNIEEEYLEKTFAVVEAAYLSIAERRSVDINEIVSRPRTAQAIG